MLNIFISSELNLAAAAHVSDRVTDEVIESLSRSYKTLVGDVSRSKSGSSPDGVRSGSRSRLNSTDSSRHDASDLSITDASHHSDQSPMVSLVLNYLLLKKVAVIIELFKIIMQYMFLLKFGFFFAYERQLEYLNLVSIFRIACWHGVRLILILTATVPLYSRIKVVTVQDKCLSWCTEL